MKQPKAIQYKNTKELTAEQLQELFLSVDWSSGNFPDKLAMAMRNYEAVFTAWDGDKLIGLASALDDGVMTAYIHYLLVHPAYQHQGIGKELLQLVTDKYSSYLRIVLVAYEKEQDFYKSCGFKPAGKGYVPMFITSLWA